MNFSLSFGEQILLHLAFLNPWAVFQKTSKSDELGWDNFLINYSFEPYEMDPNSLERENAKNQRSWKQSSSKWTMIY